MPVPQQEEMQYYLMPKGVLPTFAMVYGNRGGIARAAFEIGGVRWRPIPTNGPQRVFYGEYTAKEGREVDELVVYLLAQVQSHSQSQNKAALPVLVGWLNPMGYQVPVESRWVYDIRTMRLAPRRGTTMQQRQLNNMIREPRPTPRRSRRSGGEQAPGAPRAKRTRRQRQRRGLQQEFDEEAQRLENPLLIHDDMEDDEELPAFLASDGDEEDDLPQDMDERHFLIDLAMDALRGSEEYHPPDVPRGGVAHLGRDVRIRGGGRRQEPPEMEPEEVEAHNLFARALAGQMMNPELPQRQPTFRRAVAIPVTITRSHMVEDAPQPPQETPRERIRRMQAALAVSDSRTRNSAERDIECVVCRNEYATEGNMTEPDRVLRVVLDGCNHELCRNCSLVVAKCPTCRAPMAGTSTDKSTCADCIMRSSLTAPGTVRMLPCQHLCLCRACADARVADANFTCPVCLENANNWQVVG
jgi:hypothetical protein